MTDMLKVIEEIRTVAETQDIREGEEAILKYWKNEPLTHHEWIAIDKLSCFVSLPQEVSEALHDYFEYCFND